MAPPTSFTKTTLSYPLYSAEWDPYNRGYLVVGGGGGENRSGVENKITLLDTSSRGKTEPVADISLTRDEDSVMTLANLASKDGLITFAGINSGERDRLAGKNQHLRTFLIDYPKKRKVSQEKDEKESPETRGKISLHSKGTLFKVPPTDTGKKDTDQRILRLSPAQKSASGSKRIGAIATGLSKEPEIVVFNATVSSPGSSDVIQRINPPENAEANDIDIYELDPGSFLVAYCTDHSIFISRITYDFNSKRAKSVTSKDDLLPTYTIPFADVFEGNVRSTIRAMRFLTPSHILLLTNRPNRKGADLQVLKIDPKARAPGEIILKKKLPSHIAAGALLEVRALDVDALTGEREIAIAVAGQDISIEVYILDYTGPAKNTLSKFNKFISLSDIHPFQMTKLTFSPFHSPWPAPAPPPTDGSEPEKQKPPGPQYLRLASTSLGNTLVIDTFPLEPLSTKKRGSRYILSGRSSEWFNTAVSILTALVVLMVGMMLFQSFINYQNGGESEINIIPKEIQNIMANLVPAGDRVARMQASIQSEHPHVSEVVESVKEMGHEASHRLKDLVHQLGISYHSPDNPSEEVPLADMEKKAILVAVDPEAESSLTTEVLPADILLEAEVRARKWEEFTEEEKEKWKHRLVKAGKWAVEEGETVLKGIFFSEIGGAVGRAFAQAME